MTWHFYWFAGTAVAAAALIWFTRNGYSPGPKVQAISQKLYDAYMWMKSLRGKK